MKIFRFLIFLLSLAAWSLIGVAQSTAEPQCPSKLVASRPKMPPRPASMGVVNGRARDLVIPKYPAAAKAVNVAGDVQVAVVIDEVGCVIKADVQSGHPFLRRSALNAAKASTFHPILLSGSPISVWGLIVYRFQTEHANWLELGYSSHDFEYLTTHLPPKFELQQRLMVQEKNASADEKQILLADAHAAIDTYLKLDSRSQWLYELGQLLRKDNPTTWGNRREKSVADLRYRISQAPAGISEHLTKALIDLTSVTEWDDIRDKTQFLLSQLHQLGK